MIETSPTTAKLDAALAKAQSRFTTAAKDTENPFFKSKYADLAAVWGACRSSLAEQGISVTQWLVESEGARLGIVTRLACEGEWMMAKWSLPVSKQDAQGFGSAATYGRRYALAAALGVVADEDDDGNAASEKPKASQKRETKPAARKDEPYDGPPPLTLEEMEGWRTKLTLAASIGIDKLRELIEGEMAHLTEDQRRLLRPDVQKAQSGARKLAAERISKGSSPEQREDGAA